ncbi:serine/threonine-protein kinase [Aquisphaera insulae]|uniref:serine/threonine-protein kinase n=1 Tax=Aquisphaera insulae TaxID=2712864 RepID=UPI0013EC8B7B|nr:serine/threonine-protein kinase [Aquisphaera insulae]
MNQPDLRRPGYKRGETFLRDGSGVGSIGDESGLGRFVDELTRRVLNGVSIDEERLAEEFPERAGEIRKLLPIIEGLARLDRSGLGADLAEPGAELGPSRGFASYRIVREIGRGGMGVVYEAEDVRLRRRVALKILPTTASADSRALKRFQLEAQVASWLQHPRIVPVHDVGLDGEVPFYAMQYIEGGSLADLGAEIRRMVGWADVPSAGHPSSGSLAAGLLSGRFTAGPRAGAEWQDLSSATLDPEGETPGDGASIRSRAYIRTIARLGIQAAEALGYAHDQGVVHRDVKPANLLLDRRGDLWVADFGMAEVQGGAGLTVTGDLPGTLRYMSPEQAGGERALVDRRTDVYSLGATLYEMLTLQHAVSGSDRRTILRAILEREPVPARRLNPAIPVDLATIVAKALAKEPSGRYETAWRLADDLRRFLEGRPILARSVGPVGRLWRWSRRNPVQATLMLALTASVGVGAANWREAVRQKHEAIRQTKMASHERDQKEEQRALAAAAEKEARTEAHKAAAINQFLVNKLITQASPHRNPDASRITLREALDRAAAEVGNSFKGEPEVEASVRSAIAGAYHSLGLHAQAEPHLREVLAIRRRLPGIADSVRIETLIHYSHGLVHLHRLDEAQPILDEAIEQSGRLLGPTHSLSITARSHMGQLYLSKKRYDEAERVCRECYQQAMEIWGSCDKATLHKANLLALVLVKRGNYAEAERLFRDILRVTRETRGPEDPDALVALSNLTDVLGRTGRAGEAEPLCRGCLNDARRILGAEHPVTLITTRRLGVLLRARGAIAEGEALLRSSLDAQRRTLGSDHPDAEETAALLALPPAPAISHPALGR